MTTDTQNETELAHWVAMHRVQGIGPTRFARLEKRFGSIESAWKASVSDLVEAGIGPENARAVDELRQKTGPEREMQALRKLGVTAVHRLSPEYPQLLLEIYDTPPVLYFRGELRRTEPNGVAIVGSRRCTAYGREMTRRISTGLVESGVSVFSGLARGIDAAAHQSTINAGGRTVAVVGGGLDSIYPSDHTQLARDIIDSGGAVITEYPVGVRAKPEHFPRRNRVISGLTRGVVVVEATRKSGAMLTVKWALEQDREVFAVPGNVTSQNSDGPNWLIQQGAKLTQTHEDILDELGIERASQVNAVDENAGTQARMGVDSLAREDNEINIEDRVLRHLAVTGAAAHVDDITRAVGSPAPLVSSALTMLELRGQVRQIGPMLFIVEQPTPRSDR
jgi:DNA processing protein